MKKLNILFLCTGNSCRSQMAEGWAHALKSDVLNPYSAGIETHGLNPNAVKVMAEAGVDISGQKSENINDLLHIDFDVVITVCGHAHESCPIFPANARVIHVGFEDPPALASKTEDEEEKLNCYRCVRDEIKVFIEQLPENITQPFDCGSVGDIALPKNPDPTGRASLSERAATQERGSVGDIALPKNSDPIGRASLSERADAQERGSVGDIALPKNSDPTGRASLSERAATQEHGSVGDIALPDVAKYKGRASSPFIVNLHDEPNEPLPKREKLPHEIPSWIEQGARHFITINGKHRGGDQLLEHAPHLLESARHYEKIGRWYLWLMLVMPDHIHFIATFDLSKGLKTTVSAWKRYQKKTLGIEWQSDFFEHRLRNPSEFDEKCHYIRMNPVRQGLVINSEKWPHILDRNSIDGGSVGDIALPKNSDPTGRASLSERADAQERGSVGDVALPKNPDPIGRASLSERADAQERGSVGDIALPKT